MEVGSTPTASTNTEAKMRKFKYESDHVCRDEIAMLQTIFKKYRLDLYSIDSGNGCFGDKVRKIIDSGITNNATYARKLLEMTSEHRNSI